MEENVFKSRATDPLSLALEIHRSTFHMHNIWLNLLLGSPSSSNFIDDYKSVLNNCQSKGVQRNRRSYDQLDFDLFNIVPTLYLNFFNEISKINESKKYSVNP